MRRRELPKRHRLREVLDYDTETGELRWKARDSSQWRLTGRLAGSPNSDGYLCVGVDNVVYQAHRLIWVWMTGEPPPDEIDHENLNRADNRWCNLRKATRAQNISNTRARADNMLGTKGIRRVRSGRFEARIGRNGKTDSLGIYDTPREAHAVFAAAVRDRHREFARAG